MLNENFVILGGIIAALGSIKYIINTIQGKVKPNRITFFLWALAPFVAFAAEIKQGIGIQSLMTFWIGFFLLSYLLLHFLTKNHSGNLVSLISFAGLSLSDRPFALVYNKGREHRYNI